MVCNITRSIFYHSHSDVPHLKCSPIRISFDTRVFGGAYFTPVNGTKWNIGYFHHIVPFTYSFHVYIIHYPFAELSSFLKEDSDIEVVNGF